MIIFLPFPMLSNAKNFIFNCNYFMFGLVNRLQILIVCLLCFLMTYIPSFENLLNFCKRTFCERTTLIDYNKMTVQEGVKLSTFTRFSCNSKKYPLIKNRKLCEYTGCGHILPRNNKPAKPVIIWPQRALHLHLNSGQTLQPYSSRPTEKMPHFWQCSV